MRNLFLTMALAISVLSAKAQGEYAQGKEATPGTSNVIETVKGIKMTVSNSADTWKTPTATTDWADTDWSAFGYHMQAKGSITYENEGSLVPKSGGYLLFEPTQDGTLLIMVELNKAETIDKIRIVKDGKSETLKVLNKKGQQITSISEKSVAILQVDAKANSKYYVYGNQTDLDFYGFAFGYNTVTTAASGMCTWSDTQNTVVPKGVTAYTAKVSGTTANLTKVDGTVIPANSGVVLSGTANALYVMKPAAEGEKAATLTGNELLNTASQSATPAASDKVYILVCKDGKSFFGKLKNDGQQTISTHKAYLKIDSNGSINDTNAKTIDLSFDETTGISNIEAKKADNDLYYNLAGQRISKPSKGMYIHNGKKYIAK